MQKTLSFYGTAGDGLATLEVDRTGPIDLTPFFQDAFDTYFEHIAWKQERMETNAANSDIGLRDQLAIEYKKSYNIDATKATFKFKMNDFFAMFLRRYDSRKLGEFLKNNIVDQEDFGYETLLKRLENSKEDYTRIYFEYDSGPWFRVIPKDKDITHIDIEKTIHPSKIYCDNPERQKLQDEFETRCDAELLNPETSKRTKTRRYNCTLENKVEETLRNKFTQKKIIRVYDNSWLPELDYFHIIIEYKLPIEHLEIVAKNSENNPKKE